VRPFALHSIFGPRALDKWQASALCSTTVHNAVAEEVQ
jgi:hypothetical protein